MKLVSFADLTPVPWKNGGGETRDLAIHPPGSALEDFDWRVSMARVAADGPFSIFLDVDRTLMVLDGAGFDLAIAGAAPMRLTTASAPHAFPADVATAARLVDGPVQDLNVMTRRGRFVHAVTALALDGPRSLDADGASLIVVCAAGTLAAGEAVIGPRDAIVLDDGERIDITPGDAATRVLCVTIRAA